MNAPAFTPGPWFGPNFNDTPDKATRALTGSFKPRGHKDAGDYVLRVEVGGENIVQDARLIASAPDHALICWAMCVQDATWEEWMPFDGRGEFCFAGLRYATKLDEFGCPELTPALREAISKSQTVVA